VSVRDIAETSQAQNRLTDARRIDELHEAVALVLERQETIVHALSSIIEQDTLDRLLHESDLELRVRATAARLHREDPGEQFERRRQEALRQPFIPVRGTVAPHPGGHNVQEVDVDPQTGRQRVFANSPLQEGE
jgi:hypothetical protein